MRHKKRTLCATSKPDLMEHKEQNDVFHICNVVCQCTCHINSRDCRVLSRYIFDSRMGYINQRKLAGYAKNNGRRGRQLPTLDHVPEPRRWWWGWCGDDERLISASSDLPRQLACEDRHLVCIVVNCAHWKYLCICLREQTNGVVGRADHLLIAVSVFVPDWWRVWLILL